MHHDSGVFIGKTQGVIQQIEQGQPEGVRFRLQRALIHGDIQLFFGQQRIAAMLPFLHQSGNRHRTFVRRQAFQFFQPRHGQ